MWPRLASEFGVLMVEEDTHDEHGGHMLESISVKEIALQKHHMNGDVSNFPNFTDHHADRSIDCLQTQRRKFHYSHMGIKVSENHQQSNCFFQQLSQANNKEITKDLYYWPFVMRIHQWLVDSPHKGSVMWDMFPCHDIFMQSSTLLVLRAAVWAVPLYKETSNAERAFM